jgi:hypothetical protein
VFTKASTGTKQPGEPCTETTDCAASPEGKVACQSYFDEKGGETRICQIQIDGKAGDGPCVGTRDGNVTVFSSSSSTSTTPPAPRAYVCDVGKGVYCSSGGTCTAPAELGASCATDPYSSYACVKSAFCDSATKTCLERIAAGGDCSKSSSGCVNDAYCDSTTHTCAALLADGAACQASQQCASHQCVNSACTSSGSGLSGLGALCAT